MFSKQWSIFKIENRLWKYYFDTFWQTVIHFIFKIQWFFLEHVGFWSKIMLFRTQHFLKFQNQTDFNIPTWNLMETILLDLNFWVFLKQAYLKLEKKNICLDELDFFFLDWTWYFSTYSFRYTVVFLQLIRKIWSLKWTKVLEFQIRYFQLEKISNSTRYYVKN